MQCFAKLVCTVTDSGGYMVTTERPPLLRARTLPAIVVPNLNNLLHATAFGDCGVLEGGSTLCSSGRSPKLTFTSNDSDGLNPSVSRCLPRSLANQVIPLNLASSCDIRSSLAKFAKLLNQREPKSDGPDSQQLMQVPRRPKSADSSPLSVRRVSSMDSIVDHSSGPQEIGLRPKRSPGTSPNTKSSLKKSPLSRKKHDPVEQPSVGWRCETVETLVQDSLSMTKADKKRLEKDSKINIHVHALFAAVEHDQNEKVKTILDMAEIDVNSVNKELFTPLDIAVMVGNMELASLLQSYGARESQAFKSRENRSAHLNQLVHEADIQAKDLTDLFLKLAASGNITQVQVKDSNKKLQMWQRRQRLLAKMKSGFDRLRVGKPPTLLSLEVLGENSVKINFEISRHHLDNMCTKVKVQWSADENFDVILGEKEEFDLRSRSIVVPALEHGTKYFFRIAGGNIKGYGRFMPSHPASVIPSIWRDVGGRKPRFHGKLSAFEDLFQQIRNTRPENASEISGLSTVCESTLIGKKQPKKRNLIEQLFTSAPKFQKNLSRGVYLSCIFYHEDKVLVTNEEFLPVIEVDDAYPASLNSDFLWMTKVACTWEDVKCLRQDLQRSQNASSVQFRSKLLQAAAQMQTAFGFQDLGQFYFTPLKDSSGTTILCTVQQMNNPKSVPGLYFTWLAISKLKKKCRTIEAETSSSAMQCLVASIEDQIRYNKVTSYTLSKGLYLGYLKLKSSMDSIRVMVSDKHPNVLPFVKIRDNPHVSRDEWSWLTSLNSTSDQTEEDVTEKSGIQDGAVVFERQLVSGVKALITMLGIKGESVEDHRIYDLEVLELSPEVSFILILPPVDNVCTVPGQNEILCTRKDFLSLPVQIFEMIHTATYQKDFICKYCRLSSILEIDITLAQQEQREAFSADELSNAKQRLCSLQDIQSQVDEKWKGARWIMEIISYARDKSNKGSVLIGQLFQSYLSSSSLSEVSDNRDSGIFVIGEIERGEIKRQRLDSGSESIDEANPWDPKLTKSVTSSSLEVPKLQCRDNFRKSNTSECLMGQGDFYRTTKSSESINYRSLKEVKSSNSDNRIYVERSPHGRYLCPAIERHTSEYSLQKPSAPEVLPLRKSSVPICSKTSLNLECELVPDIKLGKCLSLDRIKLNKSVEKSMLDVPKEKFLKPKWNSSQELIRRPSSSLSQNSEASGSSLAASIRSLSSMEGDDLSLRSRDSDQSLTSQTTRSTDVEESDIKSKQSGPAVIQVYAAYNSGLAMGTSVKLQITPQTTARQVVDLVVKQLNLSVEKKGKGGPVYPDDKLRSFCLVAVIGARERCLRDDFKPLYLQNPWKKGKLFVRLKTDVLSAIQQSQQSSYL